MNFSTLASFTARALAFGLALACMPRAGAEPGGEDWPCFLGPRRDGTSAETGLLAAWPEAGPPVVWRHQVGDAYSPPVAAAGKLIAFHRVRDAEVIECLDAKTGAPLWKRDYPTQYEDRYGYNNGPRCSPAIDAGRVITYGAEGALTCVALGDGKLLWQRRVNDEYKVPQGFFGAGCSPVVDDGRIFLNLGGPENAGIAAFDAATGKTLWTSGKDGASYSTPQLATIRGRRLALFFTQEGFLAADAKDGAIACQYPFRSKLYESVNAATPLVLGDEVFLSATYGTGAVLLKLGEAGLSEVWKDARAMQNHWATSIPKDGYLYGMDGRHESGSNFRCIEWKTGKVRWSADEGLGRASFILAEGRLIALGERGELALIEANPEKYSEVARARVLQYPCWTPPILSRGLLYVRNENTLLCLDLRAQKS